MSTLALINMVFILGVVVGGFIYFARMASKSEQKKGPDSSSEEFN